MTVFSVRSAASGYLTLLPLVEARQRGRGQDVALYLGIHVGASRARLMADNIGVQSVDLEDVTMRSVAARRAGSAPAQMVVRVLARNTREVGSGALRQGVHSGGMVLGIGLAGAILTTVLAGHPQAGEPHALFAGVRASFLAASAVAALGAVASAVRPLR